MGQAEGFCPQAPVARKTPSWRVAGSAARGPRPDRAPSRKAIPMPSEGGDLPAYHLGGRR